MDIYGVFGSLWLTNNNVISWGAEDSFANVYALILQITSFVCVMLHNTNMQICCRVEHTTSYIALLNLQQTQVLNKV